MSKTTVEREKPAFACPHCHKPIEVGPSQAAQALGSKTSPAKKRAARRNAQIRWDKHRQTEGAKLAATLRAEANSMSPKERKQAMALGMKIIDGTSKLTASRTD